jgi:branched-chain amino acid transport system substrate-binding protein
LSGAGKPPGASAMRRGFCCKLHDMSPAASTWRSRALAVAFALAGVCACKSSDEVRIGFVGDLGTVLGVGGRNGTELALSTLNARQGVHYELLVENDRNDPRAVQSSVASLASRGAVFVVGPMTSAMAVAAVPEANRLGLVMISPTATTDALSGKDDFFFRTAADAPAGARQLARLLHDRGLRSVVVLMDIANGSYSSSFGHAVAMEFLHAGGAAATELGYWSGKSLDFATALTRVDAQNPDAVVLVNSPTDAGIASQHLRRTLPRVVLALSPWGANTQYAQVGGKAGEGAIALQAVDLESSLPQMRDFVDRYRARFGEAPTTPAAQAYEAVMLGVDAMNRRGAKALRATLSEPGRRSGLDGDFLMDAHGDTQRALHLTEVRNGRFEPLAK